MEEKICPKCGYSGKPKPEYAPPKEYHNSEGKFLLYDYATGEFLREICLKCGFVFSNNIRPNDYQEIKCFNCKERVFDFRIVDAYGEIYICCVRIAREHGIVLSPNANLKLTKIDPESEEGKYDDFFEALHKKHGTVLKASNWDETNN